MSNKIPQRIQRTRAKGSKTPAGTRYIGRPSQQTSNGEDRELS